MLDWLKKKFTDVVKGVKTLVTGKTAPKEAEQLPTSPMNSPTNQYNVASQKLKSGTPSGKTAASLTSTPPSKTAELLAEQGSTIGNNTKRLEYVKSKVPERKTTQDPWWVKALNFKDKIVGAQELRSIADDFVTNVKNPGGAKYSFKDMLKRSVSDDRANVTGGQILRNAGVKNRAGQLVGGFALDVLLDPTSWVSFGATGAATAAGKSAAKVGAKELAEGAVKAGAKKVGKEAMEEFVENVAKKGTKAVAGNLDNAAKSTLKEIAERVAKKAADPEALDRVLNVGAGKLTKSIGEKSAKEAFKGLIFKVPFTKVEKPLVAMKKLPSELLFGAAKKLPIVGGVLKKAEDFTQYHKALNSAKESTKGAINKAGSALTWAERLTSGKGNELDHMITQVFKGLDNDTSLKVLKFIEEDGGDSFFKQVSDRVARSAKGGDFDTFIRSDVGRKAVKDSFDDVVSNMAKHRYTTNFRKTVSGLSGAQYKLPEKAITSIPKGTVAEQLNNAGKRIAVDAEGKELGEITKKTYQQVLKGVQKNPRNLIKLSDNKLDYLKGFTGNEANYWYDAAHLLDTFQKVEPKTYERRKDYVTHLFPKGEKESAEKFFETLTSKQRAAVKGTAKHRFMKQRTNDYPISELIKEGLHPETDIRKILSVRGKSAIKSQEMTKFWDALKPMGLVKEGIAGKGWTKLDIPELKGLVVRNDFAPQLKSWLDTAITNQSSIQSVLNGIESTTAPWKTLVTSMNPAFHMRNMADNTLKSTLMAGVSPGEQVGNITMGILRKLGFNPSIKTATGEVYKADDVMKAFTRLGGEGAGAFTGDIIKSAVDNPNPVQKAVNAVTKWPRKFGEGSEAIGKRGIFIDAIKKGMTPEQAMQKANDILFNYKETTPFVKGARALFPFVTWKTKNVPLVAKQMVDNPIYGNAMKSMIDEAYGASGANKNLMPDYAVEAGYLPTSQKNGVIGAIPMNLAINDLNTFSSPGNFVQDAASMLNPMFKLPLELGVMHAPMIMPDKKFKTLEDHIDYLGQTALRPLRGAVDAAKSAVAEDAPELTAKQRFAQMSGMYKPIDTGKVQVGKNYDYIDTLDQAIKGVEDSGRVVPQYSQIEAVRKAAQDYDALRANGWEKPKTQGTVATMSPEEVMAYWQGKDGILANLVKAQYGGSGDVINNLQAQGAQNPMTALAVLNRLYNQPAKKSSKSTSKRVVVPKPIMLSTNSKKPISRYTKRYTVKTVK
jgi:hypothetical protein